MRFLSEGFSALSPARSPSLFFSPIAYSQRFLTTFFFYLRTGVRIRSKGLPFSEIVVLCSVLYFFFFRLPLPPGPQSGSRFLSPVLSLDVTLFTKHFVFFHSFIRLSSFLGFFFLLKRVSTLPIRLDLLG